jgi:hypothetical protein
MVKQLQKESKKLGGLRYISCITIPWLPTPSYNISNFITKHSHCKHHHLELGRLATLTYILNTLQTRALQLVYGFLTNALPTQTCGTTSPSPLGAWAALALKLLPFWKGSF